jgi:hypothetical protein
LRDTCKFTEFPIPQMNGVRQWLGDTRRGNWRWDRTIRWNDLTM